MGASSAEGRRIHSIEGPIACQGAPFPREALTQARTRSGIDLMATPGPRLLILALALGGLLAGCSAGLGDLRFDRCHREARTQDTLYFEIFCVQRP
jgi:hypothetical protein